MMTTATAAISGAITSALDRATVIRLSSPSGLSRKPRATFSAITMAPSTIIPMAMATPPSVIRLAPMPKTFIAMNANPTEKGIENTTTRLGRQPPSSRNTTIATSRPPCHSAVVTVAAAFSTRVPWS